LQIPGTKHYTAVFVHGETHGAGKSFVLTPLMDFIYGDNFTRTNNDILNSQFNGEQANKQLVMVEEIYAPGKDDRRIGVMSRLKDMITREKNSINEKHERRYAVNDYVNYYFTSNHADALPLDAEDRRFFVIEAPSEKFDDAQYAKLNSALRDPTDEKKPGILSQHILYHLLNKVDISKFNPKAQALRTEYREAVIGLTADSLDEFASRLARNPDEIIDARSPVLNTAANLVITYYSHYPRSPQITVVSLGRALSKYKDDLIPRREVRMDQNSVKYCLYAVRERAIWKEKSNREWALYHETAEQKRRGMEV